MAEYLINMFKQQFTQTDVLRAVNAPFRKVGEEGLSAMTLNNWIKRGHLPQLSEYTPGSGRRRLFSAKDAVQIAALMNMTLLRIPVGDASVYLHYFREHVELNTLPGPIKKTMGDCSLFLMAKPNGELLHKIVYENDAMGNPTDFSFLENLPGFIVINVDFIMQVVNEELAKILAESGEDDNQDDDGASFNLEAQRFVERHFAQCVIELEELEEKLKAESRNPNPEEAIRLFELKRDIESGKRTLKSKRYEQQEKDKK